MLPVVHPSLMVPVKFPVPLLGVFYAIAWIAVRLRPGGLRQSHKESIEKTEYKARSASQVGSYRSGRP